MTIVARTLSAAPPSYHSIFGDRGNKRWVFDFTNPEQAAALLDALGAVYTVDADGRYFDQADNVWKQATVNRPRFSYNGVKKKYGLLGEPTVQNLILYSSEDNAAWVNTGGATKENVVGIIDGKSAVKLTGSAASDNNRQTFGTGAATTEVYEFYAEAGGACDNMDMSISIGGTSLSRIRYTFSTTTTAVVAGDGAETAHFGFDTGITSVRGNAIHKIVLVVNSAAYSGTRIVFFWPTPTAGDVGGYIVRHHVQYSTGQALTSSPVVTEAAAVTRTRDYIYIPNFLATAEANSASDITIGVHYTREYGIHSANSLTHVGCYINSGSFLNSMLVGSNNTSASFAVLTGGVTEQHAYSRASSVNMDEVIMASLATDRMLEATYNGDHAAMTYSGANPPASNTPSPYHLYFVSVESGAQETNAQTFMTYIELGARSIAELSSIGRVAV